MILLDTTTATLTFQATSDPGADVAICVVFYELVVQQQLRQIASEIQNPQVQTSKMASGGTVKITCLSAPAQGYRRLVKTIFLKAGTNAVQYTFRYEDSVKTVNAVPMVWSCLGSDTIQYEDGKGWFVTDLSGFTK